MHSPFTACLSQKEDNSVVVDGGAVVEFFCLSISYGYCLESLESERLLYETKYLNVFFLHHQRNKNRIRSRNHNPSSLAQNRTAFFPPQHWKIDGIVNPQYKSGPPVRVDPTGFPDPSGLQATTYAFASWQVICNITKPKPKAAPFCVSYLAFYNDSVIPCNTCGCGDIDTDTCNANARQLLLPPDSLLVPFENRTLKAKWRTGLLLWIWGKAGLGYENVYSFNGSGVSPKNQTIFFQRLRGMNFLIGFTNGTHPARDPKHLGTLNIPKGDGFPKRVLFNGEECELPKFFPKKSSGLRLSGIGFLPSILLVIMC
ncbi:hypothetical protein HID58_045675, partial [Brassica napus]